MPIQHGTHVAPHNLCYKIRQMSLWIYVIRAIDMAFERMYKFDLVFFFLFMDFIFMFACRKYDGTIFSAIHIFWLALRVTSLHLTFLILSAILFIVFFAVKSRPKCATITIHFEASISLSAILSFFYFYSPHPSTLSLCYEMLWTDSQRLDFQTIPKNWN